MKNTHQATLRDRLIDRNDRLEDLTPIEIPLIGIIAADVVAEIQQLAIAAREGDLRARDSLYSSFERRLTRMGFILRPWPNTPGITGIWDRDDVNQEGWIVFAELLASWDGKLPFVKYLFARYPWRLRDRILRGIGKPLPPIGTIAVSSESLEMLLFARDDEQPESALMASGLLEEMINQLLVGVESAGKLTALKSPETMRSLQKADNKVRTSTKKTA